MIQSLGIFYFDNISPVFKKMNVTNTLLQHMSRLAYAN